MGNGTTVFDNYSSGIKTNRDAWCYNFSKDELEKNMKTTINFYNTECKKLSGKGITDLKQAESSITKDPKKIKWSKILYEKAAKHDILKFYSDAITISMYRPFCKQNFYFDKDLNEATYQTPRLFPTKDHKNFVILVSGKGSGKEFSTLISEYIPDVQTISNGQCFPLYWYEERKNSKQTAFFENNTDDEYIRHDGITDYIYSLAKEKYGNEVTKEDVFYYVYGFLHSEDYRAKAANNLKKELPKIVLLNDEKDFWAFSKAGKELAELHLNYENQRPLPEVQVTGEESGNFVIDKMKFRKQKIGNNKFIEDKSKIIYNKNIEIINIPDKAYEYIVNGKSAIDWIIDQYRITIDEDTNKKQGSDIINDPNKWMDEHKNPRYVLDLLLSIITLSVKTVEIVKDLPKINFEDYRDIDVDNDQTGKSSHTNAA